MAGDVGARSALAAPVTIGPNLGRGSEADAHPPQERLERGAERATTKVLLRWLSSRCTTTPSRIAGH